MSTGHNQTALVQQQQRVLGASRYCKDLVQRKPELLQELLDSGDLQRSYADHACDHALRSRLLSCDSAEQLSLDLRLFRQREMLRIIWRDFNRLADTLETTRDISLLAESCVQRAQAFLHAALIERFGRPLDDSGAPQQMLVLAMGKLGARELNLSSDIDLIFCYPRAGQTDGDTKTLSNQEFFIKLGQQLITALDKVTAEGFVFRVDMRLRPYGDSGPLVSNFASLDTYYQEQGRDWERYALIKARPISGDRAPQVELMRSLQPFVFRRYIDFGVIESLRSMKQMINAEVIKRQLQADIKLGHGGIREVEFIAQCMQLIRGGRCPALRRRELLPVLEACVVEGCLPAKAAAELRDAYLFLRDTEHAIQGFDDRQTQALPDAEPARDALLLALGFPSWDAFIEALDGHRNAVKSHFEQLIAEPDSGAVEALENSPQPWFEMDEQSLLNLGYADPATALEALIELRDSSRLRTLQVQGRERLDRFLPELVRACAEEEQPTITLLRVLPLVQSVARRSAYLALLNENPAALQILVRLCGASPWISEQLSRHPVLLDELLNVESLYGAPDKDQLREELCVQLAGLPEEDLEAHMDSLRLFKASCMLTIAASEVTGRLPLMQVSDKLSFLAEVLLEQALELAWRDLSRRHGTPVAARAGRGFTILGYGKLGGIELGHGSDLDLVFLYDSSNSSATDGERPLDPAVFYTRLGQRIIHILDARTAMGQLYEVDMRLRPSGNSGLLVTSLAAFEDYQLKSAWTWEHQALVRARPVAGDEHLAEAFAHSRREILCRHRDAATLANEVVEMRAKMRDHLLPAGLHEQQLFHLKHGRGGIVDIEFMVQYAVLAWAEKAHALLQWTDNVRLLQTLADEKLLPADECEALIEAYLALRSASHVLALQQQDGVVPEHTVTEYREVVTAAWAQLLGETL